MPEYMINGIPVNFPYEPYAVQTTYMEKVIECLKQGVNGMLESPTGTGKSLCLLCASLSWLTLKKAQIQASRDEHMHTACDELLRGLQNEPGPCNSGSTWSSFAPKIIYATRTHSQLTQVIQELKKAGYGHIKVTVLGSREQLCIHPTVRESQDNIVKINKCQVLVRSKNCYFQYNLERKTNSDPGFMNNGIMDIEDLVKMGEKEKVCPYFLARDMRQDADIIFIPYNYILDRKRLRTQGVQLMGNVIILDEAHNIEKICEESVSLQICSTEIALCISEVTQVMKHFVENDELPFADVDDLAPVVSQEHLCLVKTMFLELEKAIDDIELKSEEQIFPGSYIIDLLAKAKVDENNYELLKTMLEAIIQVLSVSGTTAFQFKGVALQKVVELLDVVFVSDAVNFPSHLKCLKKNFKVHITTEETKSTNKSSESWNSVISTGSKTKGKIIRFMCFTPSYGMKEMMKQGVRCVIFTSGTLSPMPELISELDVPIPVTLQNPHVIGPGQVNVSIITNGSDGYELNSSFKTRDDPRYVSSLGNTILNVFRIVPHGLLVFFTSYPMMYKVVEIWKQSGLWSTLIVMKQIFVEPKGKEDLSQMIKAYYDAIQDKDSRGACFFAVTRGKVSEGLDFTDVNGRAVMVTGIPYPPMLEAYVKLKKDYLKENYNHKVGKCLAPEQWYLFEATRAVNQAIGRVIRHKDDYGAIILCDTRFKGYTIKKALSSWVQPHIKIYQRFGPMIRDLKNFFVNAEQTLPPPKLSGPVAVSNLPTAVGASFDFVAGRTTKSSTTELPKSNIPLASDVIFLGEYMTSNHESNSKRVRSPESEKNLVLFDALGKPTNVINFNDMLAASSSKSLFKWNDSREEVAKTKKLKVAPPKILPLSQESVDNSGECSSSAPNVLRPSTSSSNKPTCSKEAPVSRKIDKKKYIIEVKNSLDLCTYKRFVQMCFQYDKTRDFKKMFATLQDIMLGGGRNFTNLFRDFRSFVMKPSIQEFDDYCSKMISE